MVRPEKPPVKWATIREDATERGLFAVVDEAMIGRKLAPSRRKLIVGNIVMAVAKWRETFRDCGCWKTADGYALCPWHERMLQSQVAPLRAALAAIPATPDVGGTMTRDHPWAIAHEGIAGIIAVAPDVEK